MSVLSATPEIIGVTKAAAGLTLLSVVIPAHNEEGCICSTVEHLHVELQIHKVPYEIIVVDDGSTYSTWEMLVEMQNGIPELVPVNIEGQNGNVRTVDKGLDNMKWYEL